MIADYEGNKHKRITNLRNWKGFETKYKVGGGYINLQDNSFRHFPNMSALGMSDFKLIQPITYYYAINLKRNQWICDCLLWYAFLKQAMEAYASFPQTEDRLYRKKCFGPQNLQGYYITDFNSSKMYDLLICNINESERCPRNCWCYDQPSKLIIVVNCTNLSLTKLPKYTPNGKYLHLQFSHNDIEYFSYHSYLERTRFIDLSYNKIVDVDPSVYLSKDVIIDLRYNNLKHLDKALIGTSPCNICLGTIDIKCSCESMWLSQWLKLQNCHQNIIQCSGKNITTQPKNELCKKSNIQLYIVVLIGLFILLLTVFSMWYFKFEIILIKRSIGFTTVQSVVGNSLKFDVYLSFDDENLALRKWVIDFLLLFLEEAGYRVCLPCRDFGVGGVYEEQIRRNISETISFIVVPSIGYIISKTCMLKWSQMWTEAIPNRNRKLVVINYDILDSARLLDRKTKALFRLGFALEFHNFERDFYKTLKKKLGSPLFEKRGPVETFKVSKGGDSLCCSYSCIVMPGNDKFNSFKLQNKDSN